MTLTVLMGTLVLNSDTLIFSAFLLFLGALFAFDAARYIYQSFVDERVEPSARRVGFLPWCVHGRLKWSDIEASPGLRPQATSPDAWVEWVVPMASGSQG